MEVINLGSEEDRKEVKVGALLAPEVKERMIKLLREYTDVFAWSYQDMPWLNTDIVEHRLPLRPECPPIRQKLRRTQSDMAIKTKEEVQKQIDVDEDVMYLQAKDCNEPLPNEGPKPGSQWGLIFDKAVNAYGNGIGAIIITPHGSHIPFTARLTFKYTNNMTEYEAYIMGLEEAIDLRIKTLNVCGDSALVVNQIKGEWETRQPGLIPSKDYARRLSTFFKNIEFHHIPREENQMADALATLASMIIVNRWSDVPKIDVMRLDRSSHVFAMEEVSDDKPWYHDIKCYLQSQEYPPGALNKDKKTLRRLANNFFLNEDVIYKRNFDTI
ncbi:uncharacterized protein LOC127135056 [Lathyrus oleraceus]|uniref:uncharacterized protein LOC127135056 n=1 Tax=Pisum sativum TaxID=3888 RepID=UPI0021D3B4D2|nr:uncharacterized protein LOC127135056 [Pisum sativum]